MYSPTIIDQRFGRLLYHMVCSSRGGSNRIRIIELLYSDPCNANQIATQLNLDYKTVCHHLEVLSKNGLVIAEGREYGTPWFLTPLMEKNYQLCKEIIDKR